MIPEVPSLATAPRLTVAEAELVARHLFGISARAVELPSERDQNFRLRTADDAGFVLKVANAAERWEMLDAENASMRHLAATRLSPLPVPTEDGADIGQYQGHFVRLVSWIDGCALGDTPRHSKSLLADLGKSVAMLDRALASFDHAALHRAFHWDLASAPALVERQLATMQDAALRRAIVSLLEVHRNTVAPLLPSLRRSVIHGDVNDYNVLVDQTAQRVTGIVDFGDMVFSHTVNDLAIAMAYASLGKPEPLAAAAAVAAGYHAVYPLTNVEIASLFGLMVMRLCLSVSVAGAQQAEKPDSEYPRHQPGTHSRHATGSGRHPSAPRALPAARGLRPRARAALYSRRRVAEGADGTGRADHRARPGRHIGARS